MVERMREGEREGEMDLKKRIKNERELIRERRDRKKNLGLKREKSKGER